VLWDRQVQGEVQLVIISIGSRSFLLIALKLINKILGPGRQQTMVGSSLDSVTREVQAFECFNSEGRRIILVDSPGFNDTNVSDLDVLQSIADWLKQSYGSTLARQITLILIL